MKFAIITVGYNRVAGILRLIESLQKVQYYGEQADLIISIDKSDIEDQLVSAVREVEWQFGDKKIRTFPERQGLRKHILACGDFLTEYDAIAVLEDDLFVSPSFYSYIKKCFEKYNSDDHIAGISLYKHLFNVNSSQPFEPEISNFDAYFMQFAMSWGEVWFKKQWFEFKEWYEQNNGEFGLTKGIPDCVCNWPKTSWLKYHVRYCIEKNKYFVYPYESITTCFSEQGEHAKTKLTTFQVPILHGQKDDYVLPSYYEAVKYDSFFERILENKVIDGICSEDLCVDIYGTKHYFEKKKYILSSQLLPYKIIKSFSLDMRPHEENYLNQIRGNDFFLYDTSKVFKAPKNNREAAFRYYFRLDGNPYEVLHSAMSRVAERALRFIRRK